MKHFNRENGVPRRYISLFVLLVLTAQIAGAETPVAYKPHTVTIIAQDGRRAVRVSHHGIFPLRILSAIEDGLRAQIVTEIVIRRKSRFFFTRDEIIETLEYSRSIRYNLIEGRYSIRDESTGGILYFSSRNRVLYSLAAEIECLLDENRRFTRDMAYYAEARVVMRMGRLYPPFNFLPILSYSSPWVRSEVYTP
jgi:hypothetical protein